MLQINNSMKRWYNFRLQEAIGEKILQKLIIQSSGFDKILLERIKVSLNNFSLETIKGFFEQFELSGVDSGVFSNLSSNKDLMQFYNDNQEDIDSFLNDKNWFEQSPVQNQLYTVKGYYYESIKYAINEKMVELKEKILEDND